jgi:hypothetical protein
MRSLLPALPVLLAVFFLFAPARADTGLTDAGIRQYYKDSAEIMKHPYADYLAFLKKTMTEDFVMTGQTKITMPGQPPNQTNDKLTKKDMIGGAENAWNGGKDATVSYDIKKIDIAKDGKSATVTSSTSIKHMTIPGAGGKVLFGDSGSECTDSLSLGAQGDIRISGSVCTTNLSISPGQSL